MISVRYTKAFLKDLTNIPSPYQEKIENIAFLWIPACKVYTQIIGLEKLKGYSSFYRIRSGDYRIGICITDEHIILMRVLHRREIYRKFP